MKKGYEDKQTQKARLLKVLKEGKKVTQIDLWKMLNMGENLTEKQELRNLKFYIETKITNMSIIRA